MKILALIFLFVCAAYSQPTSPDDVKPEPEKCIHDSDDDFYENIRHSGPVVITVVTGREVTTVAYKKNLIEHKTYQMSGRSRVPKDFYQVNLKRKWFLLTCLRHSFLLVAEPIK